MNIFVAKLSAETSSEDLQDLFSQYGEVLSAKVIRDRETGFSKRFGFVEMESDEDGSNAIDELNDTEYDGSNIVVKKARPREERREYNRRY
ncbi:RNA-binding protein [Rapidithrix thailandica]|uniref:RNA-binding protein n=1 Tax=Rapidithrix thailandica TaxID=413964 RepID=A0AAW9RZH7_9BACT